MTPADLRALRLRLGHTQESLARALGYRSGGVTISRKETGTSPITERDVKQLRMLEAAKPDVST